MHEWGYRYNESGRIQDLTRQQRELIRLGEITEQYIQQQQRQEHSGTTKTNLENRESKRKRIQAAKREHAQ
jgi:hypothetical protein